LSDEPVLKKNKEEYEKKKKIERIVFHVMLNKKLLRIASYVSIIVNGLLIIGLYKNYMPVVFLFIPNLYLTFCLWFLVNREKKRKDENE
jgi:fatty-acid desaturase